MIPPTPPCRMSKEGTLLTESQSHIEWRRVITAQSLPTNGEEDIKHNLILGVLKSYLEVARRDCFLDHNTSLVSEESVVQALSRMSHSKAPTVDLLSRAYFTCKEAVIAQRSTRAQLSIACQAYHFPIQWRKVSSTFRHKKGSYDSFKSWRVIWIPQAFGMIFQEIVVDPSKPAIISARSPYQTGYSKACLVHTSFLHNLIACV